MGIFDIFNFRKQAQQAFNRENFSKLMAAVKEAIINQVKANIPGSEKKALVDAIVLARITELSTGISNGLVIWLVELLKQGVPAITQLAYDYLKERVENL